jgi:hypothetical protein
MAAISLARPCAAYDMSIMKGLIALMHFTRLAFSPKSIAAYKWAMQTRALRVFFIRQAKPIAPQGSA